LGVAVFAVNDLYIDIGRICSMVCRWLVEITANAESGLEFSSGEGEDQLNPNGIESFSPGLFA
jgi:hypothetical protein